MYFSVGTIYSIKYLDWKTNPKIFGFIFYQGTTRNTPGNKIHILNLAAVQLSLLDRVRLFNIIKQLTKVESARYYTGLVLYRIFKTYARHQIKKCYRTLHADRVAMASIVNYGIKRKEDIPRESFIFSNKTLYYMAQRDIMKRKMDNFLSRDVERNDIAKSYSSYSSAQETEEYIERTKQTKEKTYGPNRYKDK